MTCWTVGTLQGSSHKFKKKKKLQLPTDIKTALKKKHKKVCSFFSSPSCCFNLCLRHEIGHKIQKLDEILEKILKDKVTYGFDLTRQHVAVVVRRPIITSLVDVSNIIGRNKDRDELLSNILGMDGEKEELRNPCVISLEGMGSIGKSTLAQLAYNHHEVLSHFQIRMWVCVFDPFDQCKVVKAIIQEINPKHKYLNKINEFQTLLHEIPALIKEGKKFFLVLDDVWNEDSKKWVPFKNILKCDAQGSRILVTTRDKKVADIMVSVHIINLEVLSDEDCLLLFRKIAFLEKHEEQPNQLEDLGKQIANRCKGLPLAAKTLGSLMRFKSSRTVGGNFA